jgi:L-ornithine N5-oxygenase
VVDLGLIERIYGIFYRQKVSRQFRHSFLCRRVIETARQEGEQVELRLHDVATGTVEGRRYDAVILATGYERSSHRRLLEPLAEYLGDFVAGRDYRLASDSRLQASIFIQGFCQASHGLSDTLLSVLPARAGEIADALYDLPRHRRHEASKVMPLRA